MESHVVLDVVGALAPRSRVKDHPGDLCAGVIEPAVGHRAVVEADGEPVW